MISDILITATKVLTTRGIAYLFYVLFVEPTKSVLVIVSNDEKRRLIEDLLTDETLMMPIAEMCARPGFKIKVPLPKKIIEKVKILYKEQFGVEIAYVNIVEVMTNREYKQRWRDYAGWRPAFLEEEMHLRSSAVDYLENLLKDCIEKRFVFETPTERFAKVLTEILGKADEVLTKVEKGAFKTKKDLDNFLAITVRHSGLIALIKDMLKYREIRFSS